VDAVYSPENLNSLFSRLKVAFEAIELQQLNELYPLARKALREHPTLKATPRQFFHECFDVADCLRYRDSRFGGDQEQWAEHIRGECSSILRQIESEEVYLENYELIHPPFGTGGYGVVHQAQHKLIPIDAAVKILEPAFGAANDVDVKRFFQEAEMLFRLNHDAIIRVFEVGMAWRRPYIVMEYFEGESLHSILLKNGRITADKAFEAVESIAHGLQHAHDNDIVHRDLKPSNVLAAPPSRFKIIDFGMGVYLERQLRKRITLPGHAPGANGYAAPELLNDPTLVDPRTDIFSLGMLWYELVTGARGSGLEMPARLRDLADLPEPHQRMIIKCLQSVQDRYQTCNELLREMELHKATPQTDDDSYSETFS
jgi:serine/threonine protein kinase